MASPTPKNGDGLVAIYAPRPFKLNTGDINRGNAGIVDIPAGLSRVSAADAAHSWTKLHTTDMPQGNEAAELSAIADIEFAELRGKLAAVTGERDELARQVANTADELEGLRIAVGQSADERVKAAEAKVAAVQGELAQLRAEVERAKAKAGK